MVAQLNNNTAMKDLQGYLTQQEIKNIYNACRNWRERVLIRLLWKSGRRISEILELKVKDINFEERNIVWTILKKKAPTRKVKPIDNFTIELLGGYIKESNLLNEHYVLHNGNGLKHISRQRAFQLIRRICNEAGIFLVGDKKPHPHHFRHSFAINLAKKAKSPAHIRLLQRTLEHSNLAVTETYLQFNDEELRELIEED